MLSLEPRKLVWVRVQRDPPQSARRSAQSSPAQAEPLLCGFLSLRSALLQGPLPLRSGHKSLCLTLKPAFCVCSRLCLLSPHRNKQAIVGFHSFALRISEPCAALSHGMLATLGSSLADTSPPCRLALTDLWTCAHSCLHVPHHVFFTYSAH